MQGVIARDAKGARWVLHQGRLHPPGVRITEQMFDAVTTRKRVKVRFSKGATVEYHLVGNIDAPARALQEQMASFVSECARIRLHYTAGAAAAQQEANVEAVERGSSPEPQGNYEIGSQGAKVIRRRHADVWHALTKALDGLKLRHSNARVGRYGPDLRTFGAKPVLFEIKSKSSAGDLHQGVGQLLIYEKLLGAVHRKVLVLPQAPRSEITSAIRWLDMTSLIYTRKGRSVEFDEAALKRLLKWRTPHRRPTR